MKIAFITTPAYGHINPMIALAQELQARNHSVVMYANPSFRPSIEAAGIKFIAHPEIAENQMHLKNAVTSVAQMLQDGLDKVLPFLLNEFAQNKPDLIVRDVAAFWGKVVEDKMNIPAVVSIPVLLVSPLTFASHPKAFFQLIKDALIDLPSLVRLQLKLIQISLTYKLRPYPFTDTISSFSKLNLVFTFKEFQPFQSLYSNLKFIFISNFSVQNITDIDFNFDENRQKVYVSLGTLYNKDFELLRRILDVLKENLANLQVIVAAGNDENVARLQDLPSNFIIRKYVAQAKVLDQVDLVIASGGMNTVRDAVNKQVPMIIIPMISEQEFQAGIVEKFQLGKRLNRSEVMNSNRLYLAVTQILSNLPAFQRRAAALKGKSDNKTMTDAAKLIEELWSHSPKNT